MAAVSESIRTLSRRQADRIIRVIEKDAEGRAAMKDGAGRTCAVGGLFEALGRNADPVSPSKIREVVARSYGISFDQTIELSQTNDWYSFVEDRRAALIALVNSWVEK